MRNKRREFLKLTSQTGLFMASSNLWKRWTLGLNNLQSNAFFTDQNILSERENIPLNEMNISIIGLYGPWAASQTQNDLPAFSYRRKEWTDLDTWRKTVSK